MFSKWIDRRFKQFDLVSASEVDSVDELVDTVFPRDVDVAMRPCVVDGFPIHHQQWHEFTKGNGIFVEKGREGERKSEKRRKKRSTTRA